ncbi:ATP-binding domain-containing protein [Halothiobacillus sp.]|uniref:NERD domain-containing protein n=1 Tax=Halothiobacillus sp. TaxID=1891311 RepID=UPI002601B326|nr:ATP-binding domain-containing protein [Halothiobacillus sp.]MDD4967481.1 ATP-binding domain-containing protein [Halothiobacillus sp.]
MTIFVYGEKAGRTHENQMLRTFLGKLEERWATSADWIFVIANTMWSGAEIDLVCILPSAVIVADFKSYGGTLTGTENGPWRIDGVVVKGGSKANPFQQLRDNKFSVLNWLTSKALLSGRNLGHISAGVIFSDHIQDQLDLSPKTNSWFYPTDLVNCAAVLDGLSSPELRIAQDEALEIVRRLGVQPFEWASSLPHVRDVNTSQRLPPGLAQLTAHQHEALQALCSFISADELNSFSVLGMTSTGKSRLLAEIRNEIAKAGKTAIVLKPNRRLADGSEVHANSIYAHLYIGKQGGEDEQRTDGEEAAEQKQLKIIPLRACEDSEDCVYLLDDSHLLGNSRFSTPDGKQYGSGQLLSDFFDFAEFGKARRKVVFFGDPYQIQRCGTEESVLSGNFQKARELKHQSLELKQLIDTTDGSAKLNNAFKLVSAISSQKFAALELATDEGIRIGEKKEAANEILHHFREGPGSVWYLCETHRQANTLTQWVRERLHGKKTLGAIEAGDLLEIYVTPDVRDPFGSYLTMQSGARYTVESVFARTSYQQGLKGRKEAVRFHSIRCSLHGRDEVELEVFEEFLTAEKPELEPDTAIAESAWRKSRLKKPTEGKQGELQGVESPPPPPDFTYARYGYASTVHHAQGMSQPICYVNCDHAAGRHSEGFFRWLYSALTVAERELVLLNFTEIHPFDTAVWNAGAVKVAADIAVGAGWAFQPNGIASERDQQRRLPQGLDESKDILKSAAVWLRAANAVERVGWRIARAACHPYQERYDLIGPQDEQCQLRLAYNGKNVVTAMHLDDPAHWALLTEVAEECLETNGYSSEVEALLSSVRSRMDRTDWKVVSAAETPYRLIITVVRKQDERLNIEINFDKQGLVSSVRPLQSSDMGLLEEIKGFFS